MMNKMVTLAALVVVTCATMGCANGPIRSFFGRGACDTCPQMDPSLGMTSSCPGGACLNSAAYMGDAMIQSDPYMTGSGGGDGTITSPFTDAYGGSNLDSTIVPPTSNQTLPGPG